MLYAYEAQDKINRQEFANYCEQLKESELDGKRKEVFKKKRDEIIVQLTETCKSISEIGNKSISDIEEILAKYKKTLQNLDNYKKNLENRLEDFGEYKGVCVHDYPTYPNSLTNNYKFRICGICQSVNPHYHDV